jgi:hypothetical protein
VKVDGDNMKINVPNKTPKKVTNAYLKEIISSAFELIVSKPNGSNTIRNKKTNIANNTAASILFFIPGLYGNGCFKTVSIFILPPF